jgi:hypothetical protein
MMAMTTSNSINVNAPFIRRDCRIVSPPPWSVTRFTMRGRSNSMLRKRGPGYTARFW